MTASPILYKIKKGHPINISSQKWILLATVFITGACVLVIELVGTRALSPFYGSGVYTWSALISITLLALSIGYYAGGLLSDRYPDFFGIYFLILGAGLWTLITPWLAVHLLPDLATNFDIRIGILISSFVLFFPNLALLGAISPYCIRLLTQSHNIAGSISGEVFAVSTIGSLLGALATGFYVIPNYGVKTVFMVCGSVLIILALLGSIKYLYDRKILTVMILSAICLSFASTFKTRSETTLQIIDQQPSFYGLVQVIIKDGIKMLLVDGIAQNYVSESTSYKTPYIDFMTTIPELILPLTTEKKSALVIGLGAGELPALLKGKGIATDAVEINPAVGRFAKLYFSSIIDESNLHYMDGRVFISQTDKTYDYIFMDAFSAEQVSWHLVTKEAFDEAKAKLAPDGLLALNLTSTEDNQDIKSIQQTLKTSFPFVRSFMLDSETSLTSIVYLASSNPIQLTNDLSQLRPLTAIYISRFIDNELDDYEGHDIYTDDFNPISNQRLHVHLLWRERMREFLSDEEMLWLTL